MTGVVGLLAGGVAGRFLDPGKFEAPEMAYSDPIIRQGSVLLSRPGARFAFSQQYFHKAIVLITEHRANRDVGLILNRPTTILTTQLGIKGPPFQVLFGGDCEGLRSFDAYRDATFLCLHTLEGAAAESEEVIRGVYVIDFKKARELVLQGRAQTTDFLLAVGYCGWGSGQLQRELDGGDTWKLASIDSRLIMRELREEALELRALPRLGLDDGIASWRRLYAIVDSGPGPAAEQEDLTGDWYGDAMLREWVQNSLGGGGGDERLELSVQPFDDPALQALAEALLKQGGSEE